MKAQGKNPNKTLATAVSLRIRDDIINGLLPPGDRLHTSELGKRYDISLIPLREALSRLASTGFVVAEDQKGFRVANISAKELLDITSARICIEKEALTRSINNGDLNWESEVLAAHHRLVSIGMMNKRTKGLDPEWEKAHADFHDKLLSACDSKWLIRIAELLRDQTSRYRYLSVKQKLDDKKTDKHMSRNVQKEHEMILKAVLERNAEKACDLLEKHFNATTQLVMSVIPHFEQ